MTWVSWGDRPAYLQCDRGCPRVMGQRTPSVIEGVLGNVPAYLQCDIGFPRVMCQRTSSVIEGVLG